MQAAARVYVILVMLALAADILVAADRAIAETAVLECDGTEPGLTRGPIVAVAGTGRQAYVEIQRTKSGENCIFRWQIWFRPSPANAWRVFSFQTIEERIWDVQFRFLGFVASRPIAVAVASRGAGDYGEADLLLISLNNGRIRRINPRLGLPSRNQPQGQCPIYVSPIGLFSNDQIAVDTQSMITDLPEGAKPCWPSSRWAVGIDRPTWRRAGSIPLLRLLGTVIAKQ